MQLPRLLVFDLDGTLIDSTLDLCHAVNAALAEIDRPPLSQAAITSYVGDGAATLVRRAMAASPPASHGVGAESTAASSVAAERLFTTAFPYFLQFYHEHKLDNTRLYEGVLPALRTLRERHPGLLMAVLTNKPVRPSREICDALGVAPFFFENFGGNSFATKKPEPEGLLRLIDDAHRLLRQAEPSARPLLPREVVMIGDSAVDVQTARRAGTRSLGCLYGLAPDGLVLAEPDALVSGPAEWAAALGL